MKRSKRAALFLAAALLLSPVHGWAELPDSLEIIGEEAFMNSTTLQSVTVPQGTVEIGDRAFSGCSSLSRIIIPSSVERMGLACLSDCAGDLLIVTQKGSAAMTWAQQNDVDFHAGTRYRALLIAQTYNNSSAAPTLNGPTNDVAELSQCLSLLKGTAYETAIETELTGNGILSAVQQYFSDAEEQDVSLFYYSGHGWNSTNAAERGALIGVDGKLVTALMLRQALDAIPGRKIVIIDACYSGAFVSGGEYAKRGSGNAEEPPENGAEAFLSAFIDVFSQQTRSGGNYSRYFLLTGASEREETYEGRVGGRVMGLFTASLINGMGWSVLRHAPGDYMADTDQNGTVTLREAYEYTYRKTASQGQHVQVFPKGCDWLSLGRQAN